MAAMILLTVLCVPSVVFLLFFLIALRKDRERSHYVLRVQQREIYIDEPTPVGRKRMSA